MSDLPRDSSLNGVVAMLSIFLRVVANPSFVDEAFGSFRRQIPRLSPENREMLRGEYRT